MTPAVGSTVETTKGCTTLHAGWSKPLAMLQIASLIASISDLCFSREGSGSFVRPKKVSLGYTFIEAVQEVHVHVYSLIPKVLPFPKLQARGEPGCEARRGGVCTSALSF